MGQEPTPDLNAAQEIPIESGGGGCRNCGLGCLGIVVLGGIVFGVLNASAGASLDARLIKVSAEIQELHKGAEVRRATLVTAPANDQNAVVDYVGLEWVLTTGGEGRRPAWEKRRPQLPVDIDEMVKRVAPEGTKIDLIQPSYLLRGIDSNARVDETPAGLKRYKEAVALFTRLRPALRYVRDGLSRGRCDWDTEWERGMRSEMPNLLATRAAANLMAYEASLQSPREGLQTGFEIVAYGQDIARQGTLIGGMVGIAISQIGFTSIAHTLGRPGLEGSDYRQVIDVLGTYRAPPGEALLVGERVSAVVSGLELSGRRLDQAESEGIYDEEGAPNQIVARFALIHARELKGYEHFMDREIEIARMPRDQQEAARSQLSSDLKDSYYVIAKIAIPNLSQAQRSLDQNLGMARVVRSLAAAHLLRLEKGTFPAAIDGVAAVIGEGAKDPTSASKALLGYSFENGLVRCWIAADDGVDNGGPEDPQAKSPGPRKSDDRGLQTQAPSEE